MTAAFFRGWWCFKAPQNKGCKLKSYNFFGEPTKPIEKKIQGPRFLAPAQEDDFLPEDQMFKMPKNLSVQGWARIGKNNEKSKVAHVTRAVFKKMFSET